MPRAEYLGEFELVVMLALDRLAGEAYGMEVYDEIVHATGRELSAPTVYVTLSRLERKGFTRVRMGRPTGERGGRARKFHGMTREGRDELTRSKRMLSRLWSPAPADPAAQT
jgi:DNA-binding PadR family transcriptional regulator